MRGHDLPSCAGSMGGLADFVSETFSAAAAMDVGLLAVALACQLLHLATRALAWWLVCRDALDESPTLGRVWAANVTGVAVNAVAPSRTGDVVAVVLLRAGLGHTSTAQVIGTRAPQEAIDTVFMLIVTAAVLLTGAADLPEPQLSAGPFIVAGGIILALIAAWLVLARVAAARRLLGRARRAGRHMLDGLATFRHPWRFMRGAGLAHIASWGFRFGSTLAFLQAFGIDAGLLEAMLVILAGSLASLFPVTPGAAGANQALTALFLAGTTDAATAVAFSTVQQAVLTVFNLALAALSVRFSFGSLQAARDARRQAGDLATVP